MHVFLAQVLTTLLPYGTGNNLYPIECDRRSIETVFDTNVHVEASASYPRIPETSFFAHHVNEALRKEAHDVYDTFVQEMSAPQQLWDEYAEERILRYDLDLVYSTPTLVSFYGSDYKDRGGVHGSVQYITKTFCLQDDTIRELSLEDLFLPGSRDPLFRYCEDYFKSNQCGYYGYDDYSWVGFNPEHLDAFLPTEKGILFIFQNYVVWGYDDYPMTLLIPYAALASFADPNGPITYLQLQK